MKENYQLWFAVGLLVGNTSLARFVFEKSWMNSLGQGLTAAILFFFIMGVAEWVVEQKK